MTDKRDLKRRVRERQAATGESYVTALRNVLQQAPQRPPAIAVVELIDLTDLGAPLGYKCRIAMAPRLVDRVDPVTALAKLRELLLVTDHDGSLDLMRRVTLQGERAKYRLRYDGMPALVQFVERARAGLGGVSEDGRMVAMQLDGKAGATVVLFLLSLTPDLVRVVREPSLLLGPVERQPDDPTYVGPPYSWSMLP